jgi:exodeoxyribonuclease VII small subunit
MAAETLPDDSTDPGLESRLKRLESILSALEADELDLERALQLFEEGVGHVRAAERILAETELRVEELLGEDGATRPLPGSAQGTAGGTDG